jgi:hypothetical protein
MTQTARIFLTVQALTQRGEETNQHHWLRLERRDSGGCRVKTSNWCAKSSLGRLAGSAAGTKVLTPREKQWWATRVGARRAAARLVADQPAWSLADQRTTGQRTHVAADLDEMLSWG